MDSRCVRVLRPYDGCCEEKLVIFIDEDARKTLNKNWGEMAVGLGRRKTLLEIQPLNGIDQEGYIARANQKVLDALFIEYGEEILLS